MQQRPNLKQCDQMNRNAQTITEHVHTAAGGSPGSNVPQPSQNENSVNDAVKQSEQLGRNRLWPYHLADGTRPAGHPQLQQPVPCSTQEG